MTDSQLVSRLCQISGEYRRLAKEGLEQRWERWSIDLSRKEFHEVTGGLLARQVSLATDMAGTPKIWSVHAAPILLRSLADNYITMAWILEEPDTRAHHFIQHGLGQQKLILEYYKKAQEERPDEEGLEAMISLLGALLDSQQYGFLTEVNTGSWSGLTTRGMAEEVGELDFYRFVYVPFSLATHNMWPHVAMYNLRLCTNPLHGGHRVPTVPDLPIEPSFLCNAAKYLDMAFALFDRKTSVRCTTPNAFDYLVQEFEKLFAPNEAQNNTDNEMA